MKRIGQNIWNDICDKDNIRKALHDATGEIAREGQVDEIYNMLVNETYEFHPFKHMVVKDPKERIIDYAITYPDKVLINSVLNILKFKIIPKYIDNTYSSIKGRGLHKCSKRIKRALKEHPNAVCLQTDIKKCYPSINQNICKQELRKYIKDTKCLKFLDTLLNNHHSGIPIGISLGSYIVNLFLTSTDRWVYTELKPLLYIRYMDDQLMLFNTKEEAKAALSKLNKKLKEFDLTLKNNAKIAPVYCGIHMIGYVFFPTHVKLRKRIKQNMKRKLKKVANTSNKVWKQQMASYYGWCNHANCKNLMRKTFKEKLNLFIK